MNLTPDDIVFMQIGRLSINATLVFTWISMIVLVGGAWLATRNWRPDRPPSRWRNALEIIVLAIEGQVAEVSSRAMRPVIYFAGTLFLFIAIANILAIVPGFLSPVGSLSTTVALTMAVLLAVPIFSIRHQGVSHYVRQFLQPSWVLLPFNIMNEVSRAVSLAVRLYGNVMSGAVIAAILLTIAPFFFPVLMKMLGLITGVIQAYIFAILATVYIAAAMADHETVKHKESHD
ncbi:MAG TPA: F0F1 ATP synthase subunit A [Burkholderiaceae bacterium]|nr:F0F1 ATP synthase subunit A [Burkholderiaceae bacterium]